MTASDLPNQPHADWQGMSGSVVLLRDWPNPRVVWAYGVVQEVPANFDGQLRVARLADAWQQDAEFRELLLQAGVDDEDAADPTAIALPDAGRLLGPFAGVPPRVNGFAGRGAELDRLDAVLLGGRPAAVTQASGSSAVGFGRAAVQGLGGVGKTSLAAEYAHRYRDYYAGVWWCPAQTRDGLLTSLAALAVELHVAAPDEADVERAAKACLLQLARQPTPFLLVFDNVEPPEAVEDLLPAAGARVLITSRFPDWGGWAAEVALDVLSLAEAAEFLQHRARRRDEAGAAALAEALGRLPLALDHAAAYCWRTQTSFAGYMAKVGRLIATAPRGTTYPRSVAATFRLAIEGAAGLCPAAAGLMACLAQCGPERIPLMLLKGAIVDEAERDAALLALTEVSLVRHDPFEAGTPALTVHRLVQAVALARAKEDGTAAPAAERIIEQLLSVYPKDTFRDPVSWPLCSHLTPHVFGLRGTRTVNEHRSAGLAELLVRAADYLYGRGSYPRAEEAFRTALTIRERELPTNHPDTATTLNKLGLLLREQGDLPGARRLHQRALAIRRAVLGPKDNLTATSLNDLAFVLQEQGKLAAARRLHQRALAIRMDRLGLEHPLTAANINDLGFVHQRQGDLANARSLLERALAIRERVLGPEHPSAASVRNSLDLLPASEKPIRESPSSPDV